MSKEKKFGRFSLRADQDKKLFAEVVLFENEQEVMEFAEASGKVVKKYKKRLADKETLEKAKANLPKKEVEQLIQATKRWGYRSTLEKLKEETVMSRWMHPICHACHYKPPEDPREKGRTMKRCSKCLLVLYCSKECQVDDWKNVHKQECCNPDAEADPLYEMVYANLAKGRVEV